MMTNPIDWTELFTHVPVWMQIAAMGFVYLGGKSIWEWYVKRYKKKIEYHDLEEQEKRDFWKDRFHELESKYMERITTLENEWKDMYKELQEIKGLLIATLKYLPENEHDIINRINQKL